MLMSYDLKKIKVLGYTTDFNHCECCGKENLKGTMSILDVDSGTILHFGTTCAFKQDKYDTIEAFNEAKKELNKEKNKIKNLYRDASLMAFNYLKNIFGISVLEDNTDGYKTTNYKLNCSLFIYQDCVDKCFKYLSQPIMERGEFEYSIPE